MPAQGRTLALLRLAGIVGIVTGIAMSLSDVSLLYSPAGGYESDAMLLTIPMWRLLLGHYLGVLMLPFFLIAIWHLYEGIKPPGHGSPFQSRRSWAMWRRWVGPFMAALPALR